MTNYYGEDSDMGERMEADQQAGGMASGPTLGRSRRNNRRYPCPTCKRDGVLSAREKSLRYQCSRCADLEEGAF